MKTYWMLAALLALGRTPALAEDEAVKPPPEPARQETPATKPGPTEKEVKGTGKQVDRLTAEFGVGAKEVTDLRASGLGWGEIRHALAISKESGKPLNEVMKLRDSGMGWGKIAQHYGFKLGDTRRPERSGKDTARDDKRDAVGERPDGERVHGRGGDRAGGRAGERASGRGGSRK